MNLRWRKVNEKNVSILSITVLLTLVSPSQSLDKGLLILTMLLFGWSLLVFLFPTLPPLSPSRLGSIQVHQLQLVSPSISCSISFWHSGKVKVLVSLFAFFDFHCVVRQDGKIHYWAGFLFFYCCFFRSSVLAGIKWFACISKFQKMSRVSFSWMDSGLCHFLLVWSNIFLNNPQWVTFLTQSCLVLYSFLR